MNRYYCSNGERVSQGVIDTRRSKMYRLLYEGSSHPSCSGCGSRAEGTAHVIPQSRCKVLLKTELIWTPENTFPACLQCNSVAENVSSEAITTLNNYEEIKRVIKKYDYERYTKLPV
jgi:5-methylcytosine-specific restriction endonuclease McrA